MTSPAVRASMPTLVLTPSKPTSRLNPRLPPPSRSSFPRSAPAPGSTSWAFASSATPTEGIRIIERIERDNMTGKIASIALEIQIPPEFPEKYQASLIHTAELCAVKKTIENPPRFDITTAVVG